MKKSIVAVLIVALVSVGIGYALIRTNDNKSSGNDTTDNIASDSSSMQGKKACELLTLEDAKKLIGENATLSEGTGDANLATTDKVNVDNCTYSADGATLGDFKQITIQRHYGDKTLVTQAYEANKKEFPGEDFAGLGDMAYITTDGKQVNAVKDQYWVVAFGGSINAGDDANKELSISAVRTALEKL